MASDNPLVEQLQRAHKEGRPLVPLLRTQFDTFGTPDRIGLVKVLRDAFGISLVEGARVAGAAFGHPDDDVVFEAEVQAVLAGR